MKRKLFTLIGLVGVSSTLLMLAYTNSAASKTRAQGSSKINLIPKQKDGSTALGMYVLPDMKGWQRQTIGSSPASSRVVKFTNEAQKTRIMMKFVLSPPPKGVAPNTAKELREAAELSERIAKDLKWNQQILESTATTYRGFPAYLTRTVKQEGGETNESKILRVADGKNTFWFFQALNGKQISAEARAKADQAWTTMTEGLKIMPEGQR